MATIEERADTYAERVCEASADNYCYAIGYYNGANEQREIDITNAQDFYCENLCPADRLAGSCSDETFKACKVMRAMREAMI